MLLAQGLSALQQQQAHLQQQQDGVGRCRTVFSLTPMATGQLGRASACELPGAIGTYTHDARSVLGLSVSQCTAS